MLVISIAMDENKGIGYKGALPWHLKEELKLFKANTLHHNILMGQTTYDGLPRKLVDRHIYVCSIDPSYKVDDEDVTVVHDLEGFLKEHENDEEEYIVCGGASIYRQAYPYCKKALISFVKGEYEVDTYFDCFDLKDWDQTKEVDYEDFKYCEFERKDEKMKKVLLFHMNGCPYCEKAKQAIKELEEEKPEYKEIEIEWIEENENAELANQYDYYSVPTIFYEGKKLYEAKPTQTYEEIKVFVDQAFEEVIHS